LIGHQFVSQFINIVSAVGGISRAIGKNEHTLVVFPLFYVVVHQVHGVSDGAKDISS